MRSRSCVVVFVGFLACAGCGKKSTDDLVKDLKSSGDKDRLIAARLLPQHKGDAAKVVPALIDALKSDKNDDVRLSAAIGLGYFGDEARDAIPALQEAERDRDARIREAARVALSRIDPSLAPKATSPGRRGK